MVNTDWTRFLENLKSRCDITDIIGSYISLERKGRLYWGCCPFHHEKTASFAVNAEGQFYKCFGGGCGAAGDVIKFVQAIESTDFMGAVELLAKKAGLELPRYAADREAKEKKEKKTLLAAICLETAKFYRKALVSEKGGQALNYLAQRGLTSQTVTKFGLGLSPDWESLPKHLAANKHNLEYAVEAGVISKKDGRYFDALGGRLITPVINQFGEVIAFGGRSFEKKPQFGKYVNTKQTPLFDKSKSLFALNLVKKRKQAAHLDSIIIVEGYMDAMALHQAGFDTTVASMGTALTQEQARLIKRYADKVYICYDGDSAGRAATLRGLDILKNEDLTVRVIQMPKDTDPDELVLEKGKEAFEKLIESALPLTDYKLKVLRGEFDFNNSNKSLAEEAKWKYASAALEVIKQTDNLVEAETYLRQLQSETGFSLDWLKRQMSETIPAAPPAKPEKKDNFSPGRLEKAKYFVLSCMLHDEPFAKGDFFPDCEDDTFLEKAFGHVSQCRKEGKKPVISVLYDLFDESETGKINYILDLTFATTLQNDEYFAECVNLIKKEEINKKISELNALHETEKDLEVQSGISVQISALLKERKKLTEVRKGDANDF